MNWELIQKAREANDRYEAAVNAEMHAHHDDEVEYALEKLDAVAAEINAAIGSDDLHDSLASVAIVLATAEAILPPTVNRELDKKGHPWLVNYCAKCNHSLGARFPIGGTEVHHRCPPELVTDSEGRVRFLDGTLQNVVPVSENWTEARLR